MNEVAVVTYRNGLVENIHHAHIAIVDARGKLLYSLGDAERVIWARSTAKPAQALAILETGAFEKFTFDQADLALMCASHSSEIRHIEQTLSMLHKVNAQESDMRCGAHQPLSDAVHRSWIKSNFSPTAVCSNCSGKHVGMLGGAQALGASMNEYYLSSHAIQVLVRQVVARLCELPEDSIQWGIDGCNLPTLAFPLRRLALIYAKLAHASDRSEPGNEAAGDEVSLAKIYQAMTDYPELVAGDGRYCTILMRSFNGQVVGKLGADASYGVGVRASGHTHVTEDSGVIKIAVKVTDGNVNVAYMLISEILERLQIGTPDQRAGLRTFHRPKILNTKGVEVGSIEFPFTLTKH